jgi:hypothetical protein
MGLGITLLWSRQYIFGFTLHFADYLFVTAIALSVIVLSYSLQLIHLYRKLHFLN